MFFVKVPSRNIGEMHQVIMLDKPIPTKQGKTGYCLIYKCLIAVGCGLFVMTGCSKPVDSDLDAKIRGILVLAEEPGIFDHESSRSMICGSIRIAIAGLTSENSRISDSTNSKLNSYAKKCGISGYKN
jgi:hypothetical protein